MNQKLSEIPVKNAEHGGLRRWLALAVALCLALPPFGAEAAARHDTIVVLLDASGSMRTVLQGTRGSRMDAAKAALRTVIAKVPQTTEIGLLVFSAGNLKSDWAFPVGPRNDAQLFSVLDSIEPKTGTPLGRYIKIAADRLLEERAKNFGYGSYRLIVVTDGEAQDQDLVNRFTPEVIARGITVDAIGVGMNKTHTLATKVHSYRGANDPAALNRALAEVFAEVRGGGNDAAGSEVFEVIAGIPDAVATAMIQAVANVPNQPIGERAKGAIDAPEPAPPTTKPQSQIQTPTNSTPQTSHSEPRRQRGSSWAVKFVIAIIAISAVRKLFMGGRK